MIPQFMAASRNAPAAMILGVPVFDASAPAIRVRGRKISNLGRERRDACTPAYRTHCSAFGSIPSKPLIRVMRRTRWMRRFDFDAEAVVRLSWRGTAADQPAGARCVL